MSQLSLFRSDPPGPVPVGLAPVDAELQELATILPAGLRLGTSSWSFPGWSGLLWDRPASRETLARDGLAAYARHPLLRTVGLDRAYYRPLDVATYRRYAAQTPDDFRFLVKAPESCTSPHPRERRGESGPNPFFLAPDWVADAVVAPWQEGLGAKAGVLLFQLSPLRLGALGGAEALLERLLDFLSALPRGPRYAVELRNRELVRRESYEALSALGIATCFNVHPSVPELADQLALAASQLDGELPIVARWMLGHGRPYEAARELYAPFDRLVEEDPAAREALAGLALRAEAGREVFVIANNKAEGSAPLSLFALARSVAERGGR